MIQFVIVGPSDAKYPCSSEHRSPEEPSHTWHKEEIQRLINLWLEENPEANFTRVELRNDTSELNYRIFADITYEVTEDGQRAIELRLAESTTRAKEEAHAWMDEEDRQRSQSAQSSKGCLALFSIVWCIVVSAAYCLWRTT